MGMLSRYLDQCVAARFCRDQSGRLVFLPFGPRRAGYYVDAPSDEHAIRAVTKMQTTASILLNLTGTAASLAVAEATLFEHDKAHLVKQLGTFIGTYAVSALLLMILPALIVQKVYKGSVRDLCSSLSTVGPELVRQMKHPLSRLQRRLIIAGLGAVLILFAVLWLAVSRVNCPR